MKPRKFETTTNAVMCIKPYADAENIEDKVNRLLISDEPIEQDANAQKIYTKRREGILPEYNVRTDKWDMAINAMDEINASKIASAKAWTDKIEPLEEGNKSPTEGNKE